MFAVDPLRFSIRLISPLNERTRMAIGVAHPSRLFLHPGMAPQGTIADWILWFAHHYLPLATFGDGTTPTQAIATQTLTGYGVRALPGFLEAFVCDDNMPCEALHWDALEEKSRVYTNTARASVHPSSPLAVQPDALEPKRDNYPFSGRGYGIRRDAPNDIATANGSILMGLCADAGVRDPDHPAFALLALLSTMDLPNDQTFPTRTNGAGWSSLYDALFVQMKGNPAVAWALEQHILRPTHLMGGGNLLDAPRWHLADHATTGSPLRAFGAALAAVAERHADAITSAKTHMEHHSDNTPNLDSAHARLGWIALTTAVLEAGTRTAVFDTNTKHTR